MYGTVPKNIVEMQAKETMTAVVKITLYGFLTTLLAITASYLHNEASLYGSTSRVLRLIEPCCYITAEVTIAIFAMMLFSFWDSRDIPLPRIKK